MNKPTTIPQHVITDACNNFDPDTAYGYWCDKGQQWTYSDGYDLDDDDTNWRITFKVRHDDNETINNSDCYGTIEPATYNIHTGQHRPRPDSFDGSAFKISVGRSNDCYWWQPFEGWNTLDLQQQRTELQQIKDLIEYGFILIVVEVEHWCTCCNTWSEIASSTIGGIARIATTNSCELAGDALDAALYDAGITIVKEAAL